MKETEPITTSRETAQQRGQLRKWNSLLNVQKKSCRSLTAGLCGGKVKNGGSKVIFTRSSIENLLDESF